MKKTFIFAFILINLFLVSLAQAENLSDYVNKGNELAGQKKYEEAIQEYEKALALSPKNVDVHLLLGLSYANFGNLEKALEHIKTSVKLNPSYTPYYYLGLIYSAQSEFKKALDAFDKALSFNPDSYTAEYQKGLLYTRQKKNEKASLAYERAIELNPNFEEARIALAGEAQREGKKEIAQKQVEELRAMNKTELANALAQWISSNQTTAPPKEQ